MVAPVGGRYLYQIIGLPVRHYPSMFQSSIVSKASCGGLGSKCLGQGRMIGPWGTPLRQIMCALFVRGGVE